MIEHIKTSVISCDNCAKSESFVSNEIAAVNKYNFKNDWLFIQLDFTTMNEGQHFCCSVCVKEYLDKQVKTSKNK